MTPRRDEDEKRLPIVHAPPRVEIFTRAGNGRRREFGRRVAERQGDHCAEQGPADLHRMWQAVAQEPDQIQLSLGCIELELDRNAVRCFRSIRPSVRPRPPDDVTNVVPSQLPFALCLVANDPVGVDFEAVRELLEQPDQPRRGDHGAEDQQHGDEGEEGLFVQQKRKQDQSEYSQRQKVVADFPPFPTASWEPR